MDVNAPSAKTPEAPWAVEADAVVSALASHAQRGLSQSAAKERLARFGPNVLREKPRRSPIVAFLMQFADWMIGLLAAAALVSAFIGEWEDSLLIALIVLANGVIGFAQEHRAENALLALRKLSEPTARVWRDGQVAELPALQLVPGDLIELHAGDLVPADARLLSAVDLQADESTLTGESMPVDKGIEPREASAGVGDRTNMVHAGTAVVHGAGQAVVSATGMQTELGQIAALLETAEAGSTPLQERLATLSKRLAVAVVAICAAIFTIGLVRGQESPERMFLVAVSLAVAAVPEGLPAVITIALALGSQRMSRRKAIVRQLAAVETLGSVNVICSDKTGTLTQNKMSVSDWVAAADDPQSRADLIRAAVLCNDAHVATRGEIVGSATEAAIVTAAAKEAIHVEEARASSPRVSEFAFDSTRKRMSTVHRSDGGHVILVKGAAETILGLSTGAWGGQNLDDESRKRLEQTINDLAGRGRRVLAVGRRQWTAAQPPQSADEAESELQFLGLIGIVDPPRPEAREAIERCRQAGIRPVMITGDHLRTAVAIADDLALWKKGVDVIDGHSLSQLSDDELRGRAGRIAVFARVSPEHKLRIVRAYQSSGCVVSMTGDGVNDAPALKQADIGVAMGITGTDVSKQAARMVLADDNFATIVAAVEEGRVVYDNIRRFVQYLLTANLSEILLVLLAIVSGLPLPLLPVHLLWINLATDGLPALALAYEPAEADLMRRPPRRREESLFAEGLARDIFIFGALMALGCFGLFYYVFAWAPRFAGESGNEQYARTAVFVALAMFQLWYVLGLRSFRRSILRAPPWQNWRLLGAVAAGAAAQIAIVYVPVLQPFFHTVPLRAIDLAICVAFPMIVLLVFELTKPIRSGLLAAKS